MRKLGDEHLLETAMAAQVLHGASLKHIFRHLVDSFHIAALDVTELKVCQIWGKQWIKLLKLLYEEV